MWAENYFNLPRGTIRATVLIETLPAAFEMDEILYELQDHVVGLNAGRWDYIFSTIKKLRASKEIIFPDRAQITMTVPFMRAYSDLLVKTCHRRGAHAMGGMAAFIPSRKDPIINEVALGKVRDDKEREARGGFDGTWVAHPDLVPVATEVFDKTLGQEQNQISKQREDVIVTAEDLLNTQIPDGKITEAGVTSNINVALQYLTYWLEGTGAVALNNLMEDAATAEISRAQLWQWTQHQALLEGGLQIDAALYCRLRDQEIENLKSTKISMNTLKLAAKLLDQLVLNPSFEEFLTTRAYEMLDDSKEYLDRTHTQNQFKGGEREGEGAADTRT